MLAGTSSPSANKAKKHNKRRVSCIWRTCENSSVQRPVRQSPVSKVFEIKYELANASSKCQKNS